MTDKERFEKEINDIFGEGAYDFSKMRNGKYINVYAHIMWTAWQAARRWIPTEEEQPPCGEMIEVVLPVRSRFARETYQEVWQVIFDENREPRNVWSDYISEFEFDDVSHWRRLNLPELPEDI